MFRNNDPACSTNQEAIFYIYDATGKKLKKIVNDQANISETHWKTANDNLNRTYAYGYDALNRLRSADYHGGGLVANTNDTEDYGLEASYDKNGNIIDLERKGAFLNNGIVAGIDLIDDLVYDYRPKTNQLERVTDSG